MIGSRGTIRAVIALALPLILGASAAQAADNKAPSTPKDLRVTGATAYGVSLAWSASTDNSGIFHYVIQCGATGETQTFPQTATTAVFTNGIGPSRTFWFRMYAVDGSNNWSKVSNTTSNVITPKDTTAPAKPVVTVTHTGPSHVSIAWSTVDDCPSPIYVVTFNGSVIQSGIRDTTATYKGLPPNTTFTFTVQARDSGGNWSPVSDPVSATTDPADANDHSPPTTPTNFSGEPFGDGETWFSWTASTDNVDSPEFIQYLVYNNGVLEDTPVGYTQSVVYLKLGQINTVELYAMDSAGNISPPTTLTFDLR
jgi:chitodextrinase